MRTTLTRLIIPAAVLVAAAWMGCKENPPASLFDPSYVSGPQPVITGITPSVNVLGGVTMLTIAGQNFNTTPGNNLVFFNDQLATVVSASATQMQLKTPIIDGDSIKVKVAVYKSDLFSPTMLFRIGKAADDKFGAIGAAEDVVSMDCDTAGNIYASMLATGLGIGVWRFTPAGVRDGAAYSPAFSTSVGSWRGMKFGPGRALYCVAGRNIVFRIPAGGGTPAVWASGSGLTALNDLDFDQDGNIWAAGAATASIFRISPAKAVQAFPFVGTVRAVRVYNGFLYVGGKRDSLEKIWRFPITAGALGAEEEYFNLSTLYGANNFGATAMTFNTDGDLYIGTDAPAAIVIVHTTKAYENMYPGLLTAPTVYFTWGNGFSLFQSRGGTAKAMVNINTLKTGAPYYGRFMP